MAIKLEVGKYYKSREGKIVGPIINYLSNPIQFWAGDSIYTDHCWYGPTGKPGNRFYDGERDLVEEYIPTPIKSELLEYL
jgi:hypothetical protein